jgi:hypothetical protein
VEEAIEAEMEKELTCVIRQSWVKPAVSSMPPGAILNFAKAPFPTN